MFALILSFSGPYMFICELFMAKYRQVGLEWVARLTEFVGSYVLDIWKLFILLRQKIDCIKTAVYALKKYLINWKQNFET